MTKMEILEAINAMGLHFANTTNEKYAKTHTKDEIVRLYESSLEWFNRNKIIVK